jgi:PBSX family phage portal protein
MSQERTDDRTESTIAVHVDKLVPTEGDLDKATDSTQLQERRIRARAGHGIKPPYTPDRLAAFLELNETHAAAVRKKARYEVGFGFDIVPHEDVEADEASDDERATVEEFWRGHDSRWQTGPHQSAEPTTPVEVLELARQDYHAIGWACIEILVNNVGEPVGLAHVPANTVRVRKPPADDEVDATPSELDMDQRGYVQIRQGRRRYFGEAGDRYRGQHEDDDRDPIFVDAENGDVVTGSAERLDNQPANELIYVRNPSPLSDHYGIPDWIASLRTITADEAAKDYNRQFFDNDTIPRMVIKVSGGELTEESRRDLRQMVHGLKEESHRTVVLEVSKFQQQLDQDVEIEIEPISQGVTEEMSFEALREKNEHDIAKAHEVPPVLIGVTETSNRSNSQAQVQEFATDVIQPEQHKFAERLYQLIHQQAFGVTDWTLEFELRGADRPKEDATIARKKIQAVRGAIPINRALEMIGEDPLPEEHPVDGQTLVSQVGKTPGGGGGPAGGDGGSEVESSTERPEFLPPTTSQVGEREGLELADKQEIATEQFDSSNLDQGLYDFEDEELYIRFDRDEGVDSLYVYLDVPPEEWEGLVNASSHGSFHHENIRLDYAYEEITDHHDRLPEATS